MLIGRFPVPESQNPEAHRGFYILRPDKIGRAAVNPLPGAVVPDVVAFKIASVLVLSPRFEILGPVGIYAVRTFGKEGMFYLLFAVMVLWTLVPLALAYLTFSRFRREEI